MRRDTEEALIRALAKTSIPAKEIADDPVKAGMRFVFGDLRPVKPDPPLTPSKDENAR